MKDWIRENVDPPGMEKRNLGSLFSAVGKVFEKVLKDAERAFKAHFPYLADLPSLRRHAKSLGIPEFPHDREDEFRERVSAASFFLSRAGEREYVTEQMRGHFGDGFVLREEFLRVLVRVAEMNAEDREWVHGLLDGLLDPNVALTVAEWFRFLDEMDMSEELRMRADRSDRDGFGGDFRCDGRMLCDQGRRLDCDGSWTCDGSVAPSRFAPARGTVLDRYVEEVLADGRRKCDGGFDCSGVSGVFSPDFGDGPVLPAGAFGDSFSATVGVAAMEDAMRMVALCDGSVICDGSNAGSMADGPLTIRTVRRLRCDGRHSPTCSACDGSIICDGSYTGYDGKYCAGDKVSEEVLR